MRLRQHLHHRCEVWGGVLCVCMCVCVHACVHVCVGGTLCVSFVYVILIKIEGM